MTLLLIASCAVLVGSVAAGAAMPRRGPLNFLLAVALISWAVVNSILSFAGAVLRDLSPATLVVLSLGWLALAVLAAWRLGVGASIAPRASGSVHELLRVLRWPPVAVATVLVALTLVWRTILAVRLPVVDVLGWQYHLVTVDVWLQANAIVPVTQNVWTDGWPAAGELLTTWLAAFTRTDAMTGFTGLLPIPMAMVAAAGLARAFGAGRGPALLVGLLFGMLPAVDVLAGTSYPDTAVTAVIIAAWWLGLRILRGERDLAAFLLFGMAVGLGLGTKGTSIPLLVPIVVAVAVAVALDLVRRPRARTQVRRAIACTTVFAVPVLVLGASWYLKNLVVHGNPLFPVAFGPFAGPVAAGDFGAPPVPEALVGLGPIEQTLRSWITDWRLPRYAYNQHPGGFGIAWLAVLPFAIGGIALLARRRDFAALGLVVTPALITLAVMTSPWYARYTLYIPGVVLPLVAVALERLRPRLRKLLGLTLVGLAAVSLVFANIAPNITIPVSRGPRLGETPGQIAHHVVARFVTYVGFVFGASDAERLHVDLLKECEGFRVIPPRGRVAVVEPFMVPHAVVGPDLDRVLTSRMPEVESADALAAAMDERDATWLVTRASSPPDIAAAGAPERFEPFGTICRRGNLWRYTAAP